jgi:hypothetical protein
MRWAIQSLSLRLQTRRPGARRSLTGRAASRPVLPYSRTRRCMLHADALWRRVTRE